MRIALDTNVLVSGLLTPHGPCGEIVRMLYTGVVACCIDPRILHEYDEVLRRPKFDINRDAVEILVDYLRERGEPVIPSPLPFSLPDPDDNPFFEAAVRGSAEHLVTGNIKHYPKKLRQGVSVITPNEFVSICRARSRNTG